MEKVIIYCDNTSCIHLDKNQCSAKERLVLSRSSSRSKQLPSYFMECISFEERNDYTGTGVFQVFVRSYGEHVGVPLVKKIRELTNMSLKTALEAANGKIPVLETPLEDEAYKTSFALRMVHSTVKAEYILNDN